MNKIFASPKHLLKAIPLLFWGLSNFASAQSADSCKALVEISNDLWIASPSGALLSQVTRDGQAKFAAAISKNGKVVAYSARPNTNKVSVVDSTGRLLSTLDVQAEDMIVDLRWTGTDLLKIAEHINPTNSRFHFARVPTDPYSAPTSMPEATSVGEQCDVTLSRKDSVCLFGNSIQLNERRIYVSAIPLSSVPELQKIDVVVGTSISTSTNPSFRIEVKGISDGLIGVRLTRNDGYWVEQYVKSGAEVKLPLVQDEDGDPASIGVIVQIKTGYSGVVTFSVRKPAEWSIEAGPVWDPQGKRIAFVEKDSQDKRYLTLLQRRMENAAENGGAPECYFTYLERKMGNAAENGDALDARELLPIGGPVTSIDFLSDTKIRVVGQKIFEQVIPAHGKVPSNANYVVRDAMPQQLNIATQTGTMAADVMSWTCQ